MTKRKDPKDKKKMGRPSKFNASIMGRVEMLARDGYTDKQMAFLLDVTEQTFNNWKKSHPDFFESLKDWKAIADDNVEKSLYNRAMGYSHKEDKIFCSDGCIITEETEKHYPPDTTACIFWLKNRRKKQWRQNPDIDVDANGGNIQINVVLDDGKTEDS